MAAETHVKTYRVAVPGDETEFEIRDCIDVSGDAILLPELRAFGQRAGSPSFRRTCVSGPIARARSLSESRNFNVQICAATQTTIEVPAVRMA